MEWFLRKEVEEGQLDVAMMMIGEQKRKLKTPPPHFIRAQIYTMCQTSRALCQFTGFRLK